MLKIGNLILTNTAGTLKAQNLGNITLQNGASIVGGTLTSVGNGVVRSEDGSSTGLSGVTLSSGSQFLIGNAATLSVGGTITNNGRLMGSAGSASQIIVNGAGGVSFSGSGEIFLQNPNARILDDGGARSFTNGVNHTIFGFGQIGAGSSLVLNNQGIIGAAATVNGHETLTIQSSQAMSNSGTLRAGGGATLEINGTVVNNNGLILVGDLSTVLLTNGASIVGGSLTTSNSLAAPGVIRAADGQSASLSGVTLTANTRYLVGADVAGQQAKTFLSGVIANSGFIDTTANGGNASTLVINGAAGLTLNGNGAIRLQDENAKIVDDGGSRSFINNSLIQGHGQVGAGSTLLLDNRGSISANVNGKTLVLQTAQPITNSALAFGSGSFSATNGGTLAVQTVIAGPANFSAEGRDSKIVFGPAATPSSFSAGALSGQWFVSSLGGTIGLIDLQATNTGIAINNGSIDLFGAGGQIQGRDATGAIKTIDQTLVTNNGRLNIAQARTFSASANGGNFTNSSAAELTLDGGTFQSNSLVNSGTIRGFGALNVTGQVTGNGQIFVFEGGLTIGHGVNMGAGSGISIIDLASGSPAVLNLANATAASKVGTLTMFNGSLVLGNTNLVVTRDYDNANFGAGNAFNARANVSGSGQINAVGTAQAITGNVSNGSASVVTLDFGNLRSGAPQTLSYQVANTGAANSTDLRGAVQTSFSGGGVTDGRLSGTGVTAGNFGLIAAGNSTGGYAVTFNPGAAGAAAVLSGQSVKVVNNFGNVVSQVINIVSGAVYQPATGAIQTPGLSFGTLQLGQTISQNLVIRNSASGAAGFVEDLNAQFGVSGNSQITGLGNFSGITAGNNSSAANGSMTVRVTGNTLGALNANIGVDYLSSGKVAGVAISGLSAVASNSESYSVQGTVITGNVVNPADPVVNNAPIALGAVRIGAASPVGIVNVSNHALGGPQAALNASIASAGAPITASGSFNQLLPGNSSPGQVGIGTLQVRMDTSTAGVKAGNATVSFVSDASNLGGCAPNCALALTAQTVAVSGRVYTPAVGQIVTNVVDFGVVRVGDSVTAKNITVNNSATTSPLNDTLGASLSGLGGPFTGGAAAIGIAAGGSGVISVGLNTSAAGTASLAGSVAFISRNAEMSDLALGIAGGVQVLAQINRLANADFDLLSGLGVLTQSGADYVLELGNVVLGSRVLSHLRLANDVTGPADDLSGAFNLAGADDFGYSGWGAAVGPLAAGQATGSLDISWLANALGSVQDSIVFNGRGTNASDLSGLAQSRRLTIHANVIGVGGTVPEPSTLALILLAALGALVASSGVVQRMIRLS